MVVALCATLASFSTWHEEDRLVAMLLRTSGKRQVDVFRTGGQRVLAGVLPLAIYEGMTVHVGALSGAIIFDGRHSVPLKAGTTWRTTTQPKSLADRLLGFLSLLSGERKEYTYTAIRGEESVLTKPSVLAIAALPNSNRAVVLYAVARGRVDQTVVSTDPSSVEAGKPVLIHRYPKNDVMRVEVGPVSEGSSLALDLPPFRGEAFKIPMRLLPEDSECLAVSGPPSEDVAALLARFDLLFAGGLNVFALETAYSALDKARTPEERREVNEALWQGLRRCGSTLADTHLPVKPS